jgi:hypothetical protein
MNPYDMEDGELKDMIVKLVEVAYEGFLFSDSNVGKEIDMDELNNY